jgi:Spy/CpxP family protein refolding chaperone
MPRGWTAWVVLTVLGAALCLPVWAQDLEMKRLDLLDLPGKWWKHDRTVTALKLTTAQIDQIDALFVEHRKKLVDNKARLEKLLLDFQQVSDQAEVNRERTLQLVDQIAQARAEMVRNTILMQLDIRDRLTPEQRIALKQLKEEFKGEMRRRMLERHQEGGGGRQRTPARPGY